MATTVKTITNKDVLTFVKAVIDSGLAQEIVQATPFTSDEFAEKADKMLATLEKKSAGKAEKSSKTKAENVAFAEAVAGLMTEGTTYAVSELFADAEGVGVANKSKLSTVMKTGCEVGLFVQIDGYKVGGKGRAVKGYRLATEGEEIADSEEIAE